jgi:hypothetical protein
MRWLGVVLLAAAACPHAAPPQVADSGPCGDEVADPENEGGLHIPDTEEPEWQTNPPASGEHYTRWARWSRVYPDPIPRGHWVHNLEHGGVVFLHRDPEDAEALRAFAATLPADPICQAPISGRWLVTPDPLLPVDAPVAAVSWGFIYTAACVDTASLRRFYDERIGHGPENTCAEGQVPAAIAPSDAGPPDAP